jgi:phosphopantothenoylcysteine decarboxylase / phosphopantothenate---cysteine ligase
MQGKRILLGVSGSIAAYKAAHLTRLLLKKGAEVQVLMTPAATAFLTPLTLSTLSKRPVFTDVSGESGWNNHVELGLWADAMLIAPCTATTLAKLANGICDTMLTAAYLSARCPVFFAPAMDLDMWTHPATRANVARMASYGCTMIPPEYGELASGLVGEGRMAEPENMVAFLADFFDKKTIPQDLAGKKCLVTSGPTYEPIDPVRFIGNRSSGKMGTAIADELARRGAHVTLVTGPTQQRAEQLQVTTVRVETAQQMFDTCKQLFAKTDVIVWAAAVADYTPAQVATEKIKKSETAFQINLQSTIDIAKTLGAEKLPHQTLIGFALETNNAREHALQKLQKKNLDAIVLNSTQDAGAGFNHDTNKITIFDKTGAETTFALKTKTEVATDIVDTIVRLSKK